MIDELQRYPNRDQVELVIDLGVDWEKVEPSLRALIHDGFVVEREVDGERVYELTRTSNSRSLADLLSA